MPRRIHLGNLVHVRVEPDLRRAIEAAAREKRLSLSEYMRRGLRDQIAGGARLAPEAARHA